MTPLVLVLATFATFHIIILHALLDIRFSNMTTTLRTYDDLMKYDASSAVYKEVKMSSTLNIYSSPMTHTQ